MTPAEKAAREALAATEAPPTHHHAWRLYCFNHGHDVAGSTGPVEPPTWATWSRPCQKCDAMGEDCREFGVDHREWDNDPPQTVAADHLRATIALLDEERALPRVWHVMHPTRDDWAYIDAPTEDDAWAEMLRRASAAGINPPVREEWSLNVVTAEYAAYLDGTLARMNKSLDEVYALARALIDAADHYEDSTGDEAYENYSRYFEALTALRARVGE